MDPRQFAEGLAFHGIVVSSAPSTKKSPGAPHADEQFFQSLEIAVVGNPDAVVCHAAKLRHARPVNKAEPLTGSFIVPQTPGLLMISQRDMIVLAADGAMSRLHELLWSVCRKLPSDFTPWGERDRDADEPWQDCSCGCRHFIPLAGERGYDWGVCANPKSPRAGLLTFEHQGCPQFEAEVDSIAGRATEALPAPPPPAPGAEPAIPRPTPRIDFAEFQAALEGDDPIGDVAGHFLDTETGEILVLCRGADDYEELSERLDAGLGERYRRIDPLASHESFRIMEDFAGSLSTSRWKERLLEALSRHKPFRHFKDVVHSDPALSEQWFRFRDDAHERYMRDRLKEEGIDAEILRARP